MKRSEKLENLEKAIKWLEEHKRKEEERKKKIKEKRGPDGVWFKIGEVGVDGGTLMISDPCYLASDEVDSNPKYDHELGFHQYNYVKGHPGLAVEFNAGYGDGSYDVMAIRKDGYIAEVKIILIPEDEDEEI